jgi:hypothetical protein
MVVQDAVDGDIEKAVELAMEGLECGHVTAPDGLEHFGVGGEFGGEMGFIIGGQNAGRGASAPGGESHRFHIGIRHRSGLFVYKFFILSRFCLPVEVVLL